MLVPEIPGFTDAFPSFVWDHGILNHTHDGSMVLVYMLTLFCFFFLRVNVTIYGLHGSYGI